VDWDGKNESGTLVSSGNVFLSMEAYGIGKKNKSFADLKKLIFMK
jgi:hypothetical protein